MKLGFTFDEKALENISIDEWISKSKVLGAEAIEISPDKNIMPLSAYLEIARSASKFEIEINYHIPYFASEYYSVESFFKYPSASESKYDEFLSILDEISKIKDGSNSTIVVHGEEFSSPSEKNLEGTVIFLKYLSDAIRARNLKVKIALETLRLGHTEKAGNSRSEILTILKEVNDDRVGICLDICHDSLNYFPCKPPLDSAFYKSVIYAHVHGFDFVSGKNHLGLLKSQLNHIDQILLLQKIKPDITLNLESLSDFTGNSYLDELFLDIESIYKLL